MRVSFTIAAYCFKPVRQCCRQASKLPKGTQQSRSKTAAKTPKDEVKDVWICQALVLGPHTRPLPAWPGAAGSGIEPQNQANPCYLSDSNLGWNSIYR